METTIEGLGFRVYRSHQKSEVQSLEQHQIPVPTVTSLFWVPNVPSKCLQVWHPNPKP